MEMTVNKIKQLLDLKLKELDVLEAEKQDIISRYKTCHEEERKDIEYEMVLSENKFKKLAEEVLELKQKVKNIK